MLNHLLLTGKLHTYLADLNEQAQSRCWCLVHQMAENESVTEDLKRQSQWEWVKVMNSIVNRAGEITLFLSIIDNLPFLCYNVSKIAGGMVCPKL